MKEKIIELLAEENFKELKEFLSDANEADIAECLDDLEKGDQVTLLCYLPKKWVYVEADIKGKPSRGFLYAEMLGESPAAADAGTIGMTEKIKASIARLTTRERSFFAFFIKIPLF